MSGMMVVNVWLMMRLVMRALITVMILWRMVMIGHVRIISGFCVMSCMVDRCSGLMWSYSMMNRGSMVRMVGNGSMVDGGYMMGVAVGGGRYRVSRLVVVAGGHGVGGVGGVGRGMMVHISVMVGHMVRRMGSRGSIGRLLQVGNRVI